jgi:ABC-2 type transport system permease protein
MLERTGVYPTWVGFWTLVRREIVRFMRLWSQTLLPPAITMSLYFIIFGKFIGAQIRHIDGYAYIQYIAPGLILMSIMTNAYANTASSFYTAKFNRSVEEMLVSPMPHVIILLAIMLGGAMRGMLVGILVLGVTLLFTHIPLLHPGTVVGLAFCAACVFSLGGLINGIFARSFDDIGFVPTFILTPLTYLGGVFYSIKQLPPVWRHLSMLNPILDMVNTFRYGLLGVTDLNIYLGWALILTLFALLFLWAWLLLARGTGIKA